MDLPQFPCENLGEFLKYWISLHNCTICKAVKPLIFRPLKITKRKGNENQYFPPIVNKAARIKDKYTAIFFIVRAIFLELVLANQFKNK